MEAKMQTNTVNTAESGTGAPDRSLPMADSPELAAALEAANLQTLLMVYVHLTHDESMLEAFKTHIHPPYTNPGYQSQRSASRTCEASSTTS